MPIKLEKKKAIVQNNLDKRTSLHFEESFIKYRAFSTVRSMFLGSVAVILNGKKEGQCCSPRNIEQLLETFWLSPCWW